MIKFISIFDIHNYNMALTKTQSEEEDRTSDSLAICWPGGGPSLPPLFAFRNTK